MGKASDKRYKITWEDFKKAPLSIIVSTFFGIGLIPFAPGTFGSIAAIPLAYFITNQNCNCGVLKTFILLFLFIFLIGWIATENIKRELKIQDPSFIIIDEIASMLLIYIFTYNILGFFYTKFFGFGNEITFIITSILALISFRYFDIKKPSVIGKVDKNMDNSFGVMFDDVVAGLFSVLFIYGVFGAIYLIMPKADLIVNR